MQSIERAVKRLIKLHGGLRKAARATGIDAPYLCRLRQGVKRNPSDEVLQKLGLARHLSFRRVNGATP
jgi:hypothetical protein